jgi:TRAP-type uncharacterized transport system fused permease subunit
MTAIYTSLVVWIIGLAVPVTASYIICAVIAAPALIKLGVGSRGGAQRSEELFAGEPGQGLFADPVASGRDQVHD